mmetsp:Transcript_13471/g.32987  ORF Transcript_13471/g.32987 Transcript_13471/m.32987 type:complete len:266 (-) Transcript_13471:842-1639(-)
MLTTWPMPLMSSPRDATSVATSTLTLPLEKSRSAPSRSLWPSPPCSATAGMPSLHSAAATSSHLVLRSTNTTVSGMGGPPLDSPAASSASSAHSSSSLPASAHRSSVCATLAVGVDTAPTLTVTGWLRYACASASISRGMVAENSSVWWRCGRRAMTSLICGSKPMSSMRSASSSTRYVTSDSTHTPSFIRSSSRPGVPTTISTPRRSASTCSFLGTPPYTHTERTPHLAPASCSTWLICSASSRVGAMTSAYGPLPLPTTPASR